jgi:hypothetical protein
MLALSPSQDTHKLTEKCYYRVSVTPVKFSSYVTVCVELTQLPSVDGPDSADDR